MFNRTIRTIAGVAIIRYQAMKRTLTLAGAAAIAIIIGTTTTGAAQKGGGLPTGGGGKIYYDSQLVVSSMNHDGTAKTALFSRSANSPYGGLTASYSLHNGQRWFFQMADPSYQQFQNIAPELRFYSQSGEYRVFALDFGNLDSTTTFGDPGWVPGDQEVSFTSRRIEGAVWDENWDLVAGTVVEVGIFAVQVFYDAAGEPSGISTPYLKVATPRVPSTRGDFSAVNGYDWSPNGSALACSGNLYGNALNGGSSLFTIDASGVRVVRSANGNYWPVWAPGTLNLIAYSESMSNGGRQICTIRTDGLDRKVVYAPKQIGTGRFADGPRWSPDGTVITYYLRAPGGREDGIYRVPSSGSDKTTLLALWPAQLIDWK